MAQQPKSLKILITTIFIFIGGVLVFSFPSLSKSVGFTSVLFIYLIFLLLVYFVFGKGVKSIQYTDDAFIVKQASSLEENIYQFNKQDIEKVIFHGKQGKYDNYWICFIYKNGEQKKFNLFFESKSILPLLERLKERGFIIEYV